MKRLLAALLLVASPALAQSNGWQEIQNGWGEIQTPPSALPATAGNDGKVLTVSTGGTATEWAAAPAPGAAGSDTQVNFNDGGVLAGNAGFTFAKASKALGLTGPLTLTPGADIVPATFRAFSSGTNHIQQNQDSSNNILSGWTHAGEPFLLAGKGAGKVLTSDANGVGTWAAAGGSITNSAGANVLTKSDGTNLVASGLSETAEVLGPELVTNGTFTGGTTGWTVGAGWAYGTDNVVHGTDGASYLSRLVTGLTAGSWYKVQFTISAMTTGFMYLETSTILGAGSNFITADGTYTVYGLAGATSFTVQLYSSATARFTVDNVSAKKVTSQAGVLAGGPLTAGALQLGGNVSGVFGSQSSGVALLPYASNYTSSLVMRNGDGGDLLNVNAYAFNATNSFTGAQFVGGTATATFGINYDTYLTRGGAAATWRFGAADAAAPVAQTIKFQNATGTNAAAAATATIKGPAGTGTGARGEIDFQAAQVAASGATAQTHASRLKIKELTVALPGLPVYADNTAALAGSLVAGDVYRTATGVLMVTY